MESNCPQFPYACGHKRLVEPVLFVIVFDLTIIEEM